MKRLSPERLQELPAGVGRPNYDRERLAPGIVHLGIGAFMRGHLAAATEAAIEQHGDMRWGIVGVSLRRADTRDALAPQHGLYTLALRDAGPGGQMRQQMKVVGCVREVLLAPQNPGAVLQALAHPQARIASLTITEKGYCHDPATGRLRLDHPDIVSDLAQPQSPRSALGYLVRALALRRQQGLTGLSLLSLDNLPGNGQVLRQALLDLARQMDPGLADWISGSCSFPCSMVDRIVPRTTESDGSQVSQDLGLRDAWPVLGEPFFDWAVEDDFVAGRPDWRAGGARFVDQAAPWEQLKLRMVNGAHSTIAYLGAMAGWQTVDRAMTEPAMRRHLETLMCREIEPTLAALPGLDFAAYRTSLLQRFANPALAHKTQQIAMDGSQKLPQRLLDTVRDRLASGASIDRLALGIAGWLHYLRGWDEAGRAYPIDDPMAAELSALSTAAAGLEEPLARAQCLLRLPQVFGELASSQALAEAVAPWLERLRASGVQTTLESS